MITLKQAIELATEAHKGQWRKSEPLDKESLDLFIKLSENTLFPFILSNGNKVFCLENILVMQKPYITHPLAVMDMMSTDVEKIVAVLHNIIEDTEAFTAICDEQGHILVYNRKSYGIPSKVYETLKLLTHNKSISYNKYVKYISYNKLATKVKIADIIHNLSCSPSDNAKQKYLKAIPVLLKSL